MRALDILKSAAIQRASSEGLSDLHGQTSAYLDADVAESVDRQRAAAVVRDKLAVLDERHRMVAWEYIAKGRPRIEVAAELGVTPPRVSQMQTTALRLLKKELEKEGVKP